MGLYHLFNPKDRMVWHNTNWYCQHMLHLDNSASLIAPAIFSVSVPDVTHRLHSCKRIDGTLPNMIKLGGNTVIPHRAESIVRNSLVLNGNWPAPV
jgi:hypothetical protein